MVVLDATIVNIALHDIRAHLGFSAAEPVLGRQRLHPDLRRAAAARRPRRRPPRPPPGVPRRHRAVHRSPRSSAASRRTRPSCSSPARVQGIGGALASPSALALLMTMFPDGRERTRAIGLYTAVSIGGSARRPDRRRHALRVGVLALGAVRQRADRRACCSCSPARRCPRPRASTGRFDLAGALTSTLGMTALVYGFVHAATDGWADAETIGSFAAGLVLLAAFVLTELRAERADHPAAAVRRPQPRELLRRPAAAGRRDDGDVLLPHPVPARRARLQRPRHRLRVPAADRDGVRRLAAVSARCSSSASARTG